MERPERPPRSWVGAWEAELWTWQLKQKWGLQRDTTLSWLSAPAFPQWVTLAKFLATLSILHFLIYETDTNKWPREVCCEDQSCSRCKVLSQVLLHWEWSLKRGCFCSSPFLYLCHSLEWHILSPSRFECEVSHKCTLHPKNFPWECASLPYTTASFFMLPLKKWLEDVNSWL